MKYIKLFESITRENYTKTIWNSIASATSAMRFDKLNRETKGAGP